MMDGTDLPLGEQPEWTVSKREGVRVMSGLVCGRGERKW